MASEFKKLSLYIISVLMFSSLILPALNVSQTNAVSHIGTLYFSNRSGTAGRTDCALIQGGYTGGANKARFISAIKTALNHTGTAGCAGAMDTGAAYIVFTMLNYGLNPNNTGNVGTRDDVPASVLREWEDRINQPDVWIGTEVVNYSVNSSAPYVSSADVGQFRTGGTEVSTVFRKGSSSGPILYQVKNSCANPLGQWPGLPVINSTYDLTPTVGVNRSAGEPGESVSVIGNVANSGKVTSNSTYYAISTMAFDSTTAVPTTFAATANNGVAATDPAKPCQYYVSVGARDCRQETTATTTGNTTYDPPGRAFIPRVLVLGDYAPGTKVCYGVSIYSYNETTGTNKRWRHSGVACVTIAKKPKIQIQGGDLSVGRTFLGTTGSPVAANVVTGVSNKDISGVKRVFGSWIEYGIFATGTVTGAASGSAYSGGLIDTPAACESKLLTFTNSPTATGCTDASVAGNYASSQSIPDIASSFAISSSTPSFGASPTIDLTTSTASGLMTATGNVLLSGGSTPIAKGRWLVLNAPEATVTITGNILYTNESLASVGDIPQLVIIAKNINIADTVTQIDSWLIAKSTTLTADGRINTCSSIADNAPLSSNICSTPLTVNGPVMARALLLRRTAGSGFASSSGDPAEVFNLRPDAYLWAALQATNTGRVLTVQTTELPPRL
jgi:hypothetical protein